MNSTKQKVHIVKHVLSSHSKKDKTKILITNGSIMKVESNAECSPRSILQYFWPALSNNWYFLSGRLRQVLLYNQKSIYIYAYQCLCQSVGKVYYPLVWYAWAHHFRKWPTIFCSMGHFGPPILKKIWSPEGAMSDSVKVLSRVPQGTVLGPLSF